MAGVMANLVPSRFFGFCDDSGDHCRVPGDRAIQSFVENSPNAIGNIPRWAYAARMRRLKIDRAATRTRRR